MTKSTGATPSPAALFLHTHQRKKNSSWVDRRSEVIYENYNRSMEEMTQRASDQGTPTPNELDVWRDAAGVKKRRIYGLGLESTLLEKTTSSSSSCEWASLDTIDSMKLKHMEEEVQQLRSEQDEIRAERNEIKVKFAVCDAQLKQIMERLNLPTSNIQQDHDKEKGKEAEDDDGDEDDEDLDEEGDEDE